MPTPNLALPFIVQGQAQKEATHNEALVRLDVLVQGSVKSRTLATPPGSPADGDRWIVLAVASRTTQAITGATSYNVGVAGNASQFGGSLGIALGSTNIGVIGPTAFYANTPIRVTAASGSFTGGKVRIVLYALAFAAPSS